MVSNNRKQLNFCLLLFFPMSLGGTWNNQCAIVMDFVIEHMDFIRPRGTFAIYKEAPAHCGLYGCLLQQLRDASLKTLLFLISEIGWITGSTGILKYSVLLSVLFLISSCNSFFPHYFNLFQSFLVSARGRTQLCTSFLFLD